MKLANGIATKSPTGWFAIQFPSGRLHRQRFGSSVRAAEFALQCMNVDNWNVLKDNGFLIVPCPVPSDVATVNGEANRG